MDSSLLKNLLAGTAPREIDNPQWVKDNLHLLNPQNINETFAAVQKYHPLGGCTSLNFQDVKTLKTQSIQELAKNADAVCVACCEALGTEQASSLASRDPSSLEMNENAISNLAYIALHHSDSTIQSQCLSFIEKWKQTQ